MSDIRPTPETAAYTGTHETHRIDGLTIYGRAEKLERERDSAKTLNKTLLDQLESQAVRIEALRKTLIESEAYQAGLVADIEAMREAIKEAIPALQACSENIGNRYGKLSDDADATIAKLKPLLP